MNDLFNEQLIKKQLGMKDIMKGVGIALAGLVLIIASLSFKATSMLAMPIAIAVFIIVFFLIKRLNVEYEYILTNSELDIDTIYNKANRKHTLTVDVKDFETFVNLQKYPNEFGSVDKVLDYSSGVINENTFAALYTAEGKKCKLIIEPNENVFKAIRMFIPSKIKN